MSDNPRLAFGASIPDRTRIVEQWKLMGNYSDSDNNNTNNNSVWELESSQSFNNPNFRLHDNNCIADNGMKVLDLEIDSDFESSIDDDEESFEILTMEEMQSSNTKVDEINMDCTDDTGR